MGSNNSAHNWEMPINEVPPCKGACSNPEDTTSSCGKLCRNNKNLVSQIIEINEYKKTDH